MKISILIELMLISLCINCGSEISSDDLNPETGSIPLINCPGDVECQCTMNTDCQSNICSPVNTCTMMCISDMDCPREILSESCLGESENKEGMCGVVCDATVHGGGCEPSGMMNASCINISETYVCGYSNE